MNNIILCEGVTDFTLLQYYMRKVYSWDDFGPAVYRFNNEKSRTLKKNNGYLTIASVGGVSCIKEAFEELLDINEMDNPMDHNAAFDRVLIFTDHDEKDTFEEWKRNVKDICIRRNYTIVNEDDLIFDYTDKSLQTRRVEIKLVIIPFNEEGALETFLLNSIANNDNYDKQIIEEGNMFIDNVDKNSRYLKSRRLRLKAKFDVYFSIRTSTKQFAERADILKGIAWEQYIDCNSVFNVFGTLD